MKPTYVLPLADKAAALENVGGKGVSLAKMIRLGLPVPNGFHITTEAYRQFVEANGLTPHILAALQEVDASLPTSLEKASTAINGFFIDAVIPAELAASITEAYKVLNTRYPVPVAVRSSATAEDLPEASFAGQQETYLNIHGVDEILAAVKKCWASLWTGRAIAYRIKNKIDQKAVALAVVVQEMVNAEAAGVLFTANPINGHRAEMVINAAWGLGEAIVGGLVTPDTIVVDKTTGHIKEIDIAEKTVITVATENGTQEKPLTDARRKSPVLQDAQVVELAQIARRIETFFGTPQDIEWCRTNGNFYIVQSRPITALSEPEIAPPSDWKLPKSAYAVMRNNIVELMPNPLSPLFASLGLAALNTSLSRLMNEAFGMRGIMPEEIIIVVNHYAYNNGSVSAKGMARMIFGAGKILRMMFTGAVERWTETGRPNYYQTEESWQEKNWRSFSAVELVNGARNLTESAVDAYGALISGVIPAAWITEALFSKVYTRLIKRRGDPSAPTYLLGFDSLPIQADKSLFQLAEWARGNPSMAGYLESKTTTQLAASLEEEASLPDQVPPEAWEGLCERFYEHLQKFGHTLYDLDFVHPLPADDPTPVLEAFKLYLRSQGINPHIRQKKSVEKREQAIKSMRSRLKGLRLKWFNKFLASAQKYAPLQEDGLAEIGLAYPLIRQMLLEVGGRFAHRQIIVKAEDVFWLTQGEVLSTAKKLDEELPVESLVENISLHKAEHRAALRVNPPMALPQMKVFGFDLMSLKAKRRGGGKGKIIKGVAASPGKATGVARLLHGPQDFCRMNPGDILVAPITTPAWTPLFAMATAIVTDIGGPLSHGSIVAREYGIPAVLGTGAATRRIQDGQTITVDGSQGTVVLHPDEGKS
jgi:phosphohistidine swiveling domain-containing protein